MRHNLGVFAGVFCIGGDAVAAQAGEQSARLTSMALGPVHLTPSPAPIALVGDGGEAASMDTEETNITPGLGMGRLKFGMTREEVAAVLGEPDETEFEDEDEDDPAEDRDIAWHYQGGGLSVYFDEDDDHRMGLIETDDKRATLFDAQLGDLNIKQTENLLRQQASDVETDIDDEETSVCSDSLGITVYFSADQFGSVQISPFWADEDTVEWPE